MASSENPLEVLNAVAASTIDLITQLEAVLADITADRDSTSQEQLASSDKPLESLSLAHDSASLIRAHATKISLLIINEPFTPTAITKVLRELVSGPLPALAAAVQTCDPKRYTSTIRRDLSWRSSQILKHLKELIEKIPKDGKILSAEKKNGSGSSTVTKGSIATTGILWAACDEVIALSKLGVAGRLVKKVEEFRDTLKDVLEELKEWGEEEDDDEDDEDDQVGEVADALQTSHISDTQAMLDDLMNSQQHIPRDDPEKIRERLDSCLKRLRLTTILYQAVVKRRLKTMPKLPLSENSNIPIRLNEVFPLLKRIPEQFGSLALSFYELDAPEIDRLMDECFFDAFAVAELLTRPWDGEKDKDEFSDWASKFQVEIKKG
ncbi:hypothetical protein GQ53DRAFT_740915 [Thozetella sp. PMI_491]|nr:hypothetical protein GQ53DRAFT_740915 [Thozetella sp. PMI_491]